MNFNNFFLNPKSYVVNDFSPSITGVKSIFIDGAKFHGKSSRFFAWYGMPENIKEKQKVPAIVLVHGGGGTAFSYWVKMWNERGYAAIAMDIFGGMPNAENSNAKIENIVKSHRYSGPLHDNRMQYANDSNIENHWQYHAVASIINSHSFLASLPNVDKDNIGITGISWGGYATSLAIGFDKRFKFAAIVYGTGGVDKLSRMFDPFMPKKTMKTIQKYWEPNKRLKGVKTPVLWISGTQDFTFYPQTYEKSTNLPLNSYCSYRINLTHGQYVGSQLTEIEDFAKTIISGKNYPSFGKIKRNKNVLSVKFKDFENIKIKKVSLISSKTYIDLDDLLFREYSATLLDKTIEATIPYNCKVFYFLVEDFNNNIYSSKILKMKDYYYA